jgi:hypothetical protein
MPRLPIAVNPTVPTPLGGAVAKVIPAPATDFSTATRSGSLSVAPAPSAPIVSDGSHDAVALIAPRPLAVSTPTPTPTPLEKARR